MGAPYNTPYNTLDLLMQGGQQLGAGLSAREDRMTAEREANRPINPALQKWIQALMQPGADPAVIAQAARQDPELAKHIQELREGGGPSPAQPLPSYPDIGMRDGRPQMGPPGSFDPTRQPQAPQQGMVPPPQAMPQQSLGDVPGNVDPRMSPWGIGPQGPKPGMVSGAYMPQPEAPQAYIYPEMQQSLGNVQASAAPQAPMPQGPPRQAFGASPQTAVVPRPMPQPAQPPAPAPVQPQRVQGQQPTAFPPISRQEYATQFAPLLPTLAAARGRESTAEIAAKAKKESTQNQMAGQFVLQQLREQGMNDRQAADLALRFMGMEQDRKLAIMRGEDTLEGHRIQVGGQLGAARIHAGARLEGIDREIAGRKEVEAMKIDLKGETDSALEERSKFLRQQIAASNKADTIVGPKGIEASQEEARLALEETERELKERKAARAKRTPSAPPTAAPQATPGVPAGKIKVIGLPGGPPEKVGKVGYINPSQFNPKTMKKQ